MKRWPLRETMEDAARDETHDQPRRRLMSQDDIARLMQERPQPPSEPPETPHAAQ